ncbi:MAG: CPBP family intramembrane metalloprotease [Calditrichaeota bacterium]|nr:CPBP family intramembrane metalloprotease [Calditrichota bacterium]
MTNILNNKEIKYSLLFITIVLVATWSFAFYAFSTPETVQLFSLVMLIPAIVALILNSVRYRSFRLVFKPITTRINLKSILFSLLYPLLFIGIAAISVFIIGLAEFDKNKLSNLTQFPSIVMIIMGFILIFGEEYGWRGFLLKALAEAKGKIFAAIVVGVVWALWHAPIVYGLAKFTHMKNPLLLTVVQVGAVFVFSMPFAYSYFLSKNIFPPMLFHFIWNLYNPIVLGNIYRNQPGIMVGNMVYINGEGLAGIILGLPFLVWFIIRTKNKTFGKSDT